MNTMEMTKIVGGICGALLVFLLVGWAGEIIYHVGSSGHGDEKHASGYPIEVVEDAPKDTGKAGPTLAELMASADVAKGAKAFSKCKACHKIGAGENGVGPTLFQVFDRDIGSLDGYGYSPILTQLPGNWDAAALDAFLKKPSSYASGTKMSFGGLKKATDRVNMIAYLQSLGN